MTAAEPSGVAGRSSGVGRRSAGRATLGLVPAEQDADAAVAVLYVAHYRSLVGLAALLIPDPGTAEKVVQDSFVALHRDWRRVGSGGARSDEAAAYLRRSVVHRSRVAQRRRAPQARPATGHTGQRPLVVRAALHALPLRQREVLVLQHFAGLSPAQTARMLGTSTSAVQRRTTEAMAALQGVLDREAATPGDRDG
jgi:RNA polymerase sigma factor (sigma-70 family)